MMKWKRIGWLVVNICLFSFAKAQDTTQQIIAGRINAKNQQNKPYVILISADGFRADLAEKYNASNLLQLRAMGVKAAYMQPSFPSLTFPNHYSIVTGLYPAHHGLVDNTFYDEGRKELYSVGNKKVVADSSWYGGTPLWVLAEQQQMLSASFYWVGSESAIKGIKPTYYYIYNEKIDIDTRIQAVKNWLQLPEEKRPHLITFYFPEVDHAEHIYGPESSQAENAVHFVDKSVGKIVAAIKETGLPVNFIFVSDHGMTKIDTSKAIPMPAAIDTSKFYIPSGDALLHLYAKKKSDIKPAYKALKKEAKNYDVYLAAKMPKRWHYTKADDKYNRIGDIILIPHLPAYFNVYKRKTTTIGKHGFDPALPEMHAVFYAWGPAFKNGITIPGFENVNVYPLVATILGLNYGDIDGKKEVLTPVLK
ncbi:MAG: ectonucleotide pyrophosphatase/phosphodiesterase [Chitinophagaceae bacterium]|jgi:predicted AlkP superfamily pyrophosphatase or phosphodiesterase|nr:ectonucleotide pyrophosphatase/phosphodiesterase [Chitinophagaceae bacterium]